MGFELYSVSGIIQNPVFGLSEIVTGHYKLNTSLILQLPKLSSFPF